MCQHRSSLCGRPSGLRGFPQNVKYVVRFRELRFALKLSGKVVGNVDRTGLYCLQHRWWEWKTACLVSLQCGVPLPLRISDQVNYLSIPVSSVLSHKLVTKEVWGLRNESRFLAPSISPLLPVNICVSNVINICLHTCIKYLKLLTL